MRSWSCMLSWGRTTLWLVRLALAAAVRACVRAHVMCLRVRNQARVFDLLTRGSLLADTRPNLDMRTHHTCKK